MKNNRDNQLLTIKKEFLKIMSEDQSFVTHLHALGLSDALIKNNIGFIYDYFLARLSVKKCEEDGVCKEDNHYHALTLTLDNDLITLSPTLCPVFSKEQHQLNRFIVKDYTPTEMALNIKVLTRRQDFLKLIQELALFQHNKVKMMYVVSGPRTGVIDLAVSFFKEILVTNEHATVGVLNLPNLVREYSSDIYNAKAEIEERIARLINIDYLLIDGVGFEETNTLIRDTIIFPLFRGREEAQKATILVSELLLSDLGYLYNPSRKDVRAKQIINLIERSISKEILINAVAI